VSFDASVPGDFALAAAIAPSVTNQVVTVDSPPPGGFTQVRLFGAATGSPSGDGQLVDELIIPRLESTGRMDYLSQCTESVPQLQVETGGTFVRAVMTSGRTVTRGLFYIGRNDPRWTAPDRFPVFDTGDFVLSGVSPSTGIFHEVTLVDERADGWTTNPRLGPGMALGFVALVWDSDGMWDFTWNQKVVMPPSAAATLPPPDQLLTKTRAVTLKVSKTVCLDDSDELSDGEAWFDVIVQPSGGPQQTRSFSWNPMESGSENTVVTTFTVSGAQAAAPTLRVHAVEDDTDSIDDDADYGDTNTFSIDFKKGPVVETFTVLGTLDATGSDDFHYQVHCSADVSYA
jgi:hypothetical protein